jgi:hypothetical protein
MDKRLTRIEESPKAILTAKYNSKPSRNMSEDKTRKNSFANIRSLEDSFGREKAVSPVKRVKVVKKKVRSQKSSKRDKPGTPRFA